MTPGTSPPIPLQRPILLIGRHPECDVRIDQVKISRRHCCVALAYDRVVIRDLGSKNGLRVNGRIVDEAQIYPGDEVAIGPILYRVEGETAPPPGPPARSRPEATPPTPSPAPTPDTSKPDSLPSLPADLDGGLVPLDF